MFQYMVCLSVMASRPLLLCQTNAPRAGNGGLVEVVIERPESRSDVEHAQQLLSDSIAHIVLQSVVSALTRYWLDAV